MKFDKNKHSYSPSTSTREIIIITAERLFAERGIEGVSLREIGSEAGQSNSVAVQYHFKDRAGLIAAILEWRWKNIESHREELLQALLDKNNSISLSELLTALITPLIETGEKNDRNHFVRFLMHYLTSSNRWSIETNHGIRAWLVPDTAKSHEATFAILDLITKQLPDIPAPYVGRRLTQSLRMTMGTVVDWENAVALNKKVAPLSVLLEDQIAMIVSAVGAPVPASSMDRLHLIPKDMKP